MIASRLLLLYTMHIRLDIKRKRKSVGAVWRWEVQMRVIRKCRTFHEALENPRGESDVGVEKVKRKTKG